MQQNIDIKKDKRDVAYIFRERMTLLIAERGYNLSQFAKSIGLDRSALSQFLAPDSTRLPRAETLCAIANACGVSLDWLMGQVNIETNNGKENVPSVEALRLNVEEAKQKIADWHTEAIGYKIRYVPCTIPDLLRIQEVSDYEFRAHGKAIQEAQDLQVRQQLSHSTEPLSATPELETDVEVCMPIQTLTAFREGQGIWSGIEEPIRRKQLEHIRDQLENLYPTFRLFIYDQCDIYSSPYTLFGPLRAAIYIGNMYLVVNSIDHIKSLTRHFDSLIKSSVIPADQSSSFMTDLLRLQ